MAKPYHVIFAEEERELERRRQEKGHVTVEDLDECGWDTSGLEREIGGNLDWSSFAGFQR